MGILLFILFGALVGRLAGFIVHTKGGFGHNILLGIVGSVLGGMIMNSFGEAGITGFNLYSILVGMGGSILLVLIGRALS